MGRIFLEHMGGSKVFCCTKCETPLTNKENLESGSYQGASGRAFLFTNAVNLKYSHVQDRAMISGKHYVRDVYCKTCKLKLGWMYEFAVPTEQRHKEGSRAGFLNKTAANLNATSSKREQFFDYSRIYMMDENKDTKDSPSNCQYKLLACPSNCFKNYEEIITLNNIKIKLTLVVMKKTFLLVICKPNLSLDENNEKNVPTSCQQNNQLEKAREGFSKQNNSLDGLSLGMGLLNTTVINSGYSANSSKLASNLSRKFNQNRPVYVANNFDIPSGNVPDDFEISLNTRIFEFVGDNYAN